ncbi:uncharacterized protein LOC143023825 [Oratosquilla oratoria]|uniref:uncharacterized protein LOC143023825 n=1 Tax=Oratosquilla oratoria TaxID=337810 RepID=UPI003F75E732
MKAKLQDNQRQPKKFWKFANSKLKTKSGVVPLLSNSEDPSTICHNGKDKAEILQQQFVSVFTSEPIGPIPQPPGHADIVAVAPYLNRANVFKKLSSINTSKSCGPDEIHPRLFKELADLIAQPITVLYQKSLHYGELPLDWKEALVAPIYKKGSKKIASNYRPISLTSILCKNLEFFIWEAIMNHLTDINAISPKQYGFIHGRSTVLQLLHYFDYCSEIMTGGGVPVQKYPYPAVNSQLHSLCFESVFPGVFCTLHIGFRRSPLEF